MITNILVVYYKLGRGFSFSGRINPLLFNFFSFSTSCFCPRNRDPNLNTAKEAERQSRHGRGSKARFYVALML